MFKKHWLIAALCGAGAAAAAVFSAGYDLFSYILMPLTALGSGLRAMSLSGSAGNAGAWALYVIVCLAPLAGIFLRRKRRFLPDICWLLTSVCTFAVMYFMINPSYAPVSELILGNEIFVRQTLAVVLLSFVIAAAVTDLAWHEANDRRLLALFSGLLVLGQCLAACSIAVEIVEFTRNAKIYPLFLTAASVIGSVCIMYMLERALNMISAMREGWFGAGVPEKADALNKAAKAALAVQLIAQAAVNAASLLANSSVSSINVSASLPYEELIICVLAMLLSRFVSAGARIKSENDAFI